jgi:hypothetical protein
VKGQRPSANNTKHLPFLLSTKKRMEIIVDTIRSPIHPPSYVANQHLTNQDMFCSIPRSYSLFPIG